MDKLDEIEKNVKDWTGNGQPMSPHEFLADWAFNQDREQGTPLTTGFQIIDSLEKNKLRGKVSAIIGYGGTRKSMCALQGMVKTTTALGRSGMYSNMEMSSSDLLERLFDMTIEVQDGQKHQNSIMIQKAYANNPVQTMERLSKSMINYFGDRFKILQKSRMTVEGYDILIKQHKEIYGDMDVLAIDGLSMMGRSGKGEKDAFDDISGELKDLAKEHMIYIPLICHCSKTSGGVAGTLHTRDNSRFVRGSEKIIDNADFKIMMSLVQDFQDTTKYVSGLGWMRYHGKRTSGQIVDKVYDFDTMTMEMSEKPDNPREFEYAEPKTRKGGL